MKIKNNTVNAKQFSAKGDGQNDDATPIEKVINAGIQNVVFTNGEYKINRYIEAKKGNVNLYGNNSTIFTNNDIIQKNLENF